jgi:hypothetical protein
MKTLRNFINNFCSYKANKVLKQKSHMIKLSKPSVKKVVGFSQMIVNFQNP